MPAAIYLLIGTCILLWLVMSAPLGCRTLRRSVIVRASPKRLWSALYPFGENAGWNGAIVQMKRAGPASGRIVTGHTGRDGSPIERKFVLEDEVPGERFTLRYTSDTSLAQSFWDDHHMTVALSELPDGRAVAEVTETDSYRGMAFLALRFFALRRQASKLKLWAETGRFKPGGVFEHPATQFAMAGLSALLLWPFFGLTAQGFFLAATLTVVVGVHELGHMAAFRISGHSSARMIFVPILGGIALGDRPYDRHFEIGFSALMGAGFSVFPVVALMGVFLAVGEEFPVRARDALLITTLIAAMFNLGNLMPVWKFDGGQVLRQIFRTKLGLAAASFFSLLALAVTGLLSGLPVGAIVATGAILALVSLLTAGRSVRPKNDLVAMTMRERAVLAVAFASVMFVHGLAVVWSVQRLF